MRLWCLHVDGCQFTATQPRAAGDATAPPDEAEDPDAPENAASSEGAIDSGVLALLAVERRDETAIRTGDTTAEGLAAAAHERIDDAASDLGESAVAVVPSPALAPVPADGAVPTTVFQHLDAAFEQSGGRPEPVAEEYLRAPVGWHLAVDVSARGHPVASRVHEVSGGRAAASDWQVIDADGSILDPADVPTVYERFRDRKRSGDTGGEIDLAAAREAGLVAGDSTLTPAGTLVRDLLRDNLESQLRAAGARPVGALRAPTSAADGAHERTPLDAADALSPGDLPVSLYALDGDARRGGAELWTVVGSFAAGVDAVETQVATLRRWLADAELDFVPVLRTPDDSLESDRLQSLASVLGRPVLREHADGGPALAVEMAVADATGQPLATARVRLLDAAESADASHVAHATIDSMDRFSAVLSERAGGRDWRFPTWLAPTQVRLLALASDAHLDRCQALADALEAKGVRVDVDDRPLAVSDRFEAAAAAGIPFVALVGDSELSGETIPVTDTTAATERELTPDELAAVVAGAVDGYPDGEQGQPRLLSRRLFSSGGPDE